MICAIGDSEENDSVHWHATSGISDSSNWHATSGISGFETDGKRLTCQTKDCIYKIAQSRICLICALMGS